MKIRDITIFKHPFKNNRKICAGAYFSKSEIILLTIKVRFYLLYLLIKNEKL